MAALYGKNRKLPEGRVAHHPIRRTAKMISTAPLRYFAAPDVFITYARRDGAAYAESLANRLASMEPPFSCFIDQWHASPGVKLPPRILRAARWSRALIVIATRDALQSAAVEAEIQAFNTKSGPTLLITFPETPVEPARWYDWVAGLAPAVETGGDQARSDGKPSDGVLRRVHTAFTFWRRNRRIKWAASLGTLAVSIALVASLVFGHSASRAAERAERMTRAADAVELVLRAEDRYANGQLNAIEALQLGIQSLNVESTSWGESLVRRALMLLPAFVEKRDVKRIDSYIVLPKRQQAQVVYGPDGALATWTYDEVRSKKAGALTYLLSLVDLAHSELLSEPIEVKGFITEVRFTATGDGIIVHHGHPTLDGESALLWIPRRSAGAHPVPSTNPRAFAVHPIDGTLLVIGRKSLERWSFSPAPMRMSSWAFEDIRSATFSPDGTRLYTHHANHLIVLDVNNPKAPATVLTKLGAGEDIELYATERHVVVAEEGKVRTWNLDEENWDHEIERDRDSQIATVPHDRLLMWSQAEATFWDLGETEGSFYADAIQADCGTDRSRAVIVRDVAMSLDGKRVALACADGTAKVVSTTDGTPLAMAPLRESTAWAVYLDASGQRLSVYTRPKGHAAPGANAQISLWAILNSSTERIGPDDATKWPLAVGLASNGSSLATVFAKQGQADRIYIYDPTTGRAVAHSDTPAKGCISRCRMALSAHRLAISDIDELSIYAVEGDSIRMEAFFPLGDGIDLQFDGSAGDQIAASFNRDGAAQVAVIKRTKESWYKEESIPAGTWTMSGSPDPKIFSPVSIATDGSLAYLAPDAALEGSEVTVSQKPDGRRTLRHDDAVTVLRYVAPDTLLVGTRSGEIWSWSLGGPEPVRHLIGRHESAILELAVGDHNRIIAVGRDNILRMWGLDVANENIGLRGFMEFPLNSFGIFNYDELGAKALGFSGQRLVVVNHHARGLFASTWVIPLAEGLPDAVAARLGSLIADGQIEKAEIQR